MAMYQQGSSEDLLKSLTSYLGFPSPEAGRVLQKLLTQHRDGLMNPLYKKAKSAEDRKKVTSKELEIASGAKRAFGDDFVDRVKSLSDSLDLNEIVCADLLWKAESSKSRWGHSNLLDIAEAIFFDERHSTLKTLQMLFTARQNAHNAGDAGLLISQFTAGMLDSNLFDRLLDLLSSLLSLEEKEAQNPSSSSTTTATPSNRSASSHSASTPNSSFPPLPSSQWDHQRSERHLLAETVFIICYTTQVTKEQALKLLKVIQSFSIQFASVLASNSIPSSVLLNMNGLYHTIYVLLSAMVVVLDVCNEHEVLDVRGDKTRPLLMFDTSFVVEFNERLLNSEWQKAKTSEEVGEKYQVSVQEVLKLAWASFLRQTFRSRRADPQLASANQLFREENIDSLLRNLTPAFVYLRRVVKSEMMENDKEFKSTYTEVLDELVRSFLTTSGLKAKEMKSEEENGMRAEAAYQQYKVGPRPPKVAREFDNFLQLLASIYQGQPLLAQRFWSEEFPALTHFVRGAGDNLFESNFVSYLNMLASLASGPTCALHTFHFLSELSRKYTNWDYFFDALHQYYLDFQEPQNDDSSYYDYSGRVPNTSRLIRQISPDEVDSLLAILNVMRSVLRFSQHVRYAMLSNDKNWRVLDALFHLLSCPIPVSLKASITLTITQFAKDPSSHLFIWQYLDAAQLIGSNPSTSSLMLGLASQDASGNNGLGGGYGANGSMETPGGHKSKNDASTTQGGAGIVTGGGILFELSEIESKDESYPYTLAFVKLLNTLLTNHYHDSRDTLADVNLWPYIQFIIKDVFQRFDQRAYKNPHEKWHVARVCLRFFLSILRDSVDAFSFSEKVFNPYSEAPGGTAANATGTDSVSMAAQLAIARYGTSTLRLYRYFLSRTELLNKVITIVCAEGQADLLLATRERSKDSSLEDCIRYSLMILETVLLRQGPILASHLTNVSLAEADILAGSGNASSTASGNATATNRKLRLNEENTSILVPLHTILLRKMSDLASLALYVRYPFNHNIARLSVSIIHLLSRDTDKLALILHDQGVASDFVNGFIDKLEIEDTPSGNRDQVHYRGVMVNADGTSDTEGSKRLRFGDGDNSSKSQLNDAGEEGNLYGDESGQDDDDDDSSLWAMRAPSIREAMLAMLLECARQPEYNLTQLLFGMNPSDSSRIGHHSSYSFNRQLEGRGAGVGSGVGGRGGAKTADSAPLSVLPTIQALLLQTQLSASHPKLCSLMYELLYTLLSRPIEFGGVCRALRSSEFFRRQFDILDVSLSSASVAHLLIFASEQQSLLLPSQQVNTLGYNPNAPEASVLAALAHQQLEQELYGPLMEQRAWLLKSIALELHTTCGTNRIYAAHLLEALFTSSSSMELLTGNSLLSGPTTVDNPGRKRLTSGVGGNKTGIGGDTGAGGSSGAGGAGNGAAGGYDYNGSDSKGAKQQQRMNMRELLDALEIPLVEPLPILQGSIFFGNQQQMFGEGFGSSSSGPGDSNPSMMQGGMRSANGYSTTLVDLKACTEIDARGFSSVDVRLLYGQLVSVETQIRSVYTLAPEQSNDLIAEQGVILRRAVAWNRFQEVLKAQNQILESWRQVLEVSLLECYHLLEVNSKEIVLYELLETLLARLNHPELRLQVGPPLTSCILILTSKIRQLTFPVRVSKLKSIEDMMEVAKDSSRNGATGASSLAPTSSSATGAPLGSNQPNQTYSDYSVRGASSRYANGGRPSQLTEEILSTAAPSYLPVEQLLSILKGLTSALLRQGTALTMRSNLYGSLLNYLQFTQRSSAEVILISTSHSLSDFWTSDDEHDAISASLTQQQHQQRQLYIGTLKQLHNAAERLMEVISSDATDAPHLFQSIAFATLDALCTYECGLYGLGIVGQPSLQTQPGFALSNASFNLQTTRPSSSMGYTGLSVSSAVGAKWIGYLQRQGLLRFFLESFVQVDDAALADVLLPNADSLNDLYVFESKMAMLLSMASTPAGAISLVDANLLQQLVKFTCIDHPHQAYSNVGEAGGFGSGVGGGYGASHANPYGGVGGGQPVDGELSWMKPIHERYEAILLSVLRLVAAILTQLPRNADVASQVLDFIEAHSELIAVLLKDRTPVATVRGLHALSLVTSIFYHLAFHDALLTSRLQINASKYNHMLSQLYAKYVEQLKADFERSSGSANRAFFFAPPPPVGGAALGGGFSGISATSSAAAGVSGSSATGTASAQQSALNSALSSLLGPGASSAFGLGAGSSSSTNTAGLSHWSASNSTSSALNDPAHFEKLKFQHHQRALRTEVLHLLRNLSGTLRRLAISPFHSSTKSLHIPTSVGQHGSSMDESSGFGVAGSDKRRSEMSGLESPFSSSEKISSNSANSAISGDDKTSSSSSSTMASSPSTQTSSSNLVNLEVALQKGGKLLFGPSMQAAVMTSGVGGGVGGVGVLGSGYGTSSLRGKNKAGQTPGGGGMKGSRDLPPLSSLVISITSSLALLEAIREEAAVIIKKMQTVHQLKSDEMIQTIKSAAFFGTSIFGLDTDIDSLSAEKSTSLQLQQAVQHILGARIADQRTRTIILYQIIENALFILWRHLSFYLHEEDLSAASHSSILLFSSQSKTTKVDKPALQKDSIAALNPLVSRLQLLPPLSQHQTHIIPVILQKLKDVLDGF